jgi:hypothetical protein
MVCFGWLDMSYRATTWALHWPKNGGGKTHLPSCRFFLIFNSFKNLVWTISQIAVIGQIS